MEEIEVKDLIKKAYKDMNEIVKLNSPEVYLMPVSLYNQILATIEDLSRNLKNSRDQRERLRKQLQEVKSKLNNTHTIVKAS